MFNYFRYMIAVTLLGSVFYTYIISIEKKTITEAIDKKIPMVKLDN